MAKKSHTLLYIGLAAIAGLGLYAYMKSSQLAWTNPANAAEVTTITAWINSMSEPSRTSFMNYFTTRATQSDMDNLNALITQYWNLNQPPPGNLDNFWTNLGVAVNS